MNPFVRYGALALGLLLPVAALTAFLADPAVVRGVWLGAGLGVVFQIAIVTGLSRRFRAEAWLVSFVFAFVGRLALVVGCALGVWLVGTPPLAPTLLTLGIVLFATSVVEPLALHAPSSMRS